MTQNAAKQGKLNSFGATFLFNFLPYYNVYFICAGWGLKMIPHERTEIARILRLQLRIRIPPHRPGINAIFWHTLKQRDVAI